MKRSQISDSLKAFLFNVRPHSIARSGPAPLGYLPRGQRPGKQAAYIVDL